MLTSLAFLQGKKWSSMNVKRVYFGNWLRDYSQAVDVGSLKGVNGATIRILVYLVHSGTMYDTSLTFFARFGFSLSWLTVMPPMNSKLPKSALAATDRKSILTTPLATPKALMLALSIRD